MLYDEIKDQLKDSTGKYRTLSLFLEPLYNENNETVFTLKDYDYTHKGRFHYSLKKIYLEIADPIEYKFAIAVFGFWDHWVKICNNTTLLPYILEWREELEIKLRSQAVANILETAKSTDSKGIPAMKWVADGNWKDIKRGRPSKQEKEGETRKEAGIIKSINDDLARISNKRTST